jgi:hypothetical protein
MRIPIVLPVVLIALGINTTGYAQDAAHNRAQQASQRWHEWAQNQERFPLAAWSYFFRYEGSVEEFRRYAGAGLTMVQVPPEDYDAAAEAGLDLLIGGWENIYETPEKTSEAIARPLPAGARVAGFVLDDEPGPDLFADLGRSVRQIYNEDTRVTLPMIDMLPGWAVSYERFGMTYEQMMRRYIDEVNPPLLMNCMYPLVYEDGDVYVRPSMFYLMELYRDLALEADIGLMGFALVTPHFGYYEAPTVSELRFTVYSHLAYGAKGIWYYNYTIDGGDKFGDGLIGWETKQPTPRYAMVRELNKDIQSIGMTLLSLRSTSVRHTGPDLPRGVTPYHDGDVDGVGTFTGERFIVAGFTGSEDDTGQYVMLVNKRFSHAPDQTGLKAKAKFTAAGHISTVKRYSTETGTLETISQEDGAYTVVLDGGEGVLIYLKP